MALIRLMVGGIFLSEGIQKFLYPEELGAGRFGKIGLPELELLGPFVGGVETVCGALVDRATILLAAASAILLLRFKVNSVWLIVGGAMAGLLFYRG